MSNFRILENLNDSAFRTGIYGIAHCRPDHQCRIILELVQCGEINTTVHAERNQHFAAHRAKQAVAFRKMQGSGNNFSFLTAFHAAFLFLFCFRFCLRNGRRGWRSGRCGGRGYRRIISLCRLFQFVSVCDFFVYPIGQARYRHQSGSCFHRKIIQIILQIGYIIDQAVYRVLSVCLIIPVHSLIAGNFLKFIIHIIF